MSVLDNILGNEEVEVGFGGGSRKDRSRGGDKADSTSKTM